jgi:glucan 1,3-beta-glucosidase
MKQALRGVNLGGWLVLEPWITPSLFRGLSAKDEYNYCDGPISGSEVADDRFHALSRHRKTFITKQDFKWLADNGIQAVRIPVGYWIFGDHPPYIGAINYLDRAFDWAEEYGIRILISLHGAPGSQNGTMHSGRQGDVEWPLEQKNIDISLDVIAELAERYRGRTALLGLELLNEPSGEILRRILINYYKKAYRNIRQIVGPDVWVVFSDRFKLRRWAWALHWPFYRQTYLDSHQYQIFTQADRKLTPDGHVAKAGTIGRQLRRLGWHRHYIVGEWSAALQTQSLEGYNDEQKKDIYRRYTDAQMQAYSKADAWFYWTYKTEDRGPWSFRHL